MLALMMSVRELMFQSYTLFNCRGLRLHSQQRFQQEDQTTQNCFRSDKKYI